MRSKSYTINISPLAWKRPGIKGGMFYNTQQLERSTFGIHMRSQHGDDKLFDGPTHLDIVFFMPIPRHKTKKPQHKFYCTSTPDIDNLIKHILDTARGVLISDDRIISSLSAKKCYDKNPRTVFTLTEVE